MSRTADAGAKRLGRIPPYLFAEIDRKVREKQKAGVDVISLGIGDPDLPTPQRIVSVLQEAAADPANHRYPSYFGRPRYFPRLARRTASVMFPWRSSTRAMWCSLRIPVTPFTRRARSWRARIRT
jgi:hypothetical protein